MHRGAGSHGLKGCSSVRSFFEPPAVGTQEATVGGPSLLLREPAGRELTAHRWKRLSNSALPPRPSSFPPKAFPVADVLPPVPSDHPPTINSGPHPRTTLHSPRSSSSPRVHWWTCVQSGVHSLWQMAVWLSMQTTADQLLHSLILQMLPSVPTNFPGIQESLP